MNTQVPAKRASTKPRSILKSVASPCSELRWLNYRDRTKLRHFCRRLTSALLEWKRVVVSVPPDGHLEFPGLPDESDYVPSDAVEAQKERARGDVIVMDVLDSIEIRTLLIAQAKRVATEGVFLNYSVPERYVPFRLSRALISQERLPFDERSGNFAICQETYLEILREEIDDLYDAIAVERKSVDPQMGFKPFLPDTGRIPKTQEGFERLFEALRDEDVDEGDNDYAIGDARERERTVGALLDRARREPWFKEHKPPEASLPNPDQKLKDAAGAKKSGGKGTGGRKKYVEATAPPEKREDRAKDRGIWREWKSGKFKCKKDLAKHLNMEYWAVKRALDRDRKRQGNRI